MPYRSSRRSRKPAAKPSRAVTRRRTKRVRTVRQRGKGDTGYNPSIRPALQLTAKSRVNNVPSAVFPHEYYAVLPYHDIISLNLSTVPWQVYRFRMNSVYDPDLSGGGHQPRGRDELGNLYQSYLVFAVAYDINFMTKDTTREAIVCGAAGCSSIQTLGSLPNYQALRENQQRYVRYTRIDDMRPVANIKGKLMCRKVEGVDKDAWNDETGPFQSLMTANPNACPTLAIFAGTIDQTTMSSTVVADVKVMYYCKFFTRGINGPS